jgi:hypothetical protein
LNVIKGTEEKLTFILWHDLVMTCSVLNHLSNLDKIINNPEEIALKAVALAETNSKFDWDYFPHDY